MSVIKSVYVTPEEALAQMVAESQEIGSPITDFSEGSASRSLLEAVGIVVSTQSSVADQLKQDSYLETAQGEVLDALAESNWFVKRLPAVKASGRITITRQETNSALNIPAGWGQLTVPPAAPGTEGVGVLTLEEATFAEGAATATVTATAVVGGPGGDLAIGTKLTPTSPVLGISSQEGYEVTEAFTGGVAEETDERFRARIPIVVQGRQAKGTVLAFQAAALSIPGVLSVGVLRAGTIRSNETQVEGGHLEVVYQGAENLLSQVEGAVAEAATANQEVTVACASSLSSPAGVLQVVLEATLVVEPGVSEASIKAEAATIAESFVEQVGMGGTARVSNLVEAIHKLGVIVSINLPLTKFCLEGESGSKDIACKADQCLELKASNVKLTIEELD